ncbi:hypothetical protein [Hyphococcus sp.]|jgi:hypothetical protein
MLRAEPSKWCAGLTEAIILDDAIDAIVSDHDPSGRSSPIL